MYTSTLFTVITRNTIDKLFILLLRGTASPQAFAYQCPLSRKNKKYQFKKSRNILNSRLNKKIIFL